MNYWLGYLTATLLFVVVTIGGYHYGYIHTYPNGLTCMVPLNYDTSQRQK